MPENNDEYLSKAGIDNGRISKRFRTTLEAINNFLTVKGIVRNIDIDYQILKTAIFDYYVDVARIKEYHKINKVNFEKIYGYMAYWILRRKPLRVTTSFQGGEFINELFVTSYLISNILSEKQLDGNKCAMNIKFMDFQNLLYYNLKYRHITQQSLELMIEAFFCGCDF